jgi:uncharacterized protein YdaL
MNTFDEASLVGRYVTVLRHRLVALLVCVVAALAWVAPASAQLGPSALVVYDAPPGQPYEKLGKAYAIMLRNLLGHWDARVDTIPVHQYTAGRVRNYEATFYIGAWYDNPLPEDFLRDVEASDKTVVWFKYNFWQLARVQGFDAAQRYGFRFLFNRGLEGDPAAAVPDFFDTVSYKGEDLRKYYAFDAINGRVLADPDIGYTEVVDPARAQVVVPITNRANGMQAPYVMRAGNFWYVADLPFSYIGPRDRYLVISDLLHDMLGTTASAKAIAEGAAPQALVRLEDVGALGDATHLRTLTDLLGGWQDPLTGAVRPVPFSIALIPRFRDPLGIYNGGVPLDIHLKNARTLLPELNYALSKGARLVMHGYTHQYDATRNPWSGVSGDDFEFWDIVRNRTLPADSIADWRRILDRGIAELAGSGYTAFAFETPHYQASPNAYRAMAEKFSKVYERAVYYTSDTPNLNTTAPDRDFAVGQFFPYVIARDWYGRRVLPENLGNLEYSLVEIDPSSSLVYGVDDIVGNARVLRNVVRNGIASFFFHPFWLERFVRPDGTVYDIDARTDFRRILDSIARLGFVWTDPAAL